MGAEGYVERAAGKAEVGERVSAVGAPFEAYGQVFQEAVHSGEPYLTQSLGRLDVAPHEPVCVFADVDERVSAVSSTRRRMASAEKRYSG